MLSFEQRIGATLIVVANLRGKSISQQSYIIYIKRAINMADESGRLLETIVSCLAGS